jgi:hypothetical protein
MCLNETYVKVFIGKHLCDTFPVNAVKQEDALLPLLFNFAIEYATGKVQANEEELKSRGTHQFLVSGSC